MAKKEKELQAEVARLKLIAVALFDMLGDIDTLGDVHKPERTPYFKAVQKVQRRRFEHGKTDGYSLWFPKKPVD